MRWLICVASTGYSLEIRLFNIDILAPVKLIQEHMLLLLDGFTKEAIVSFLEEAEKGLLQVSSTVNDLSRRLSA